MGIKQISGCSKNKMVAKMKKRKCFVSRNFWGNLLKVQFRVSALIFGASNGYLFVR